MVGIVGRLHDEDTERFLALAVEIICVADMDGFIQRLNKSWERTLGHTIEESLGTRFRDYIHPDDRDHVVTLGWELLAGKTVHDLDVRFLCKDGAYKWIGWMAVPDLESKRIFSFGHDITYAKVAAELLTRSEARMRQLIEAIPDAVAVHHDGRFAYANRACCTLLGVGGAEEIIGEDVLDVVHPEDHADVIELRAEIQSTGRPSPRREIRWVRRDGTVVAVEVAAQPFELDGAPAILFIAHDLTERKRLQAQLVQADRMASVGTLAAGVAHEINNPLAYVVANLAFIAEELPELARDAAAVAPQLMARIAPMMHKVAAARQGAERVRVIAKDLKTFARVDDERRDSVDVRAVLESTLAMAEKEIGHRARLVKAYGQVPRVLANEPRLAQVLLNMLINAAQAIPEGARDGNEIRVATFTDDAGRAVAEVADTGCGMAPEVLGRIFEPFFTMKPMGVGTGLGLAICHGIVSALGGEILVESEVGKGSVFRVALPAMTKESIAPSHPPSSTMMKVAPRRARVLVIDDEPQIGLILEHALGKECDVTVASSGRAAVKQVEKSADWDVVFCDLMMPGVSGVDVYERVTAIAPSLADAFVFMTGGAFTGRAREFLASVPNVRIEKPFDLRAIAKLVRERTSQR